MTRTPVDVLDLFAGPGGWDTGIAPLGLRPLGIEWDTAAVETAQAAGHLRYQADIAALNPRDFATRRWVERQADIAVAAGGDPVRARAMGHVASPPCQGFSMAGKGKGRADSEYLLAGLAAILRDPTATHVDHVIKELHGLMTDDRSLLALEPLRWAMHLTPSWLAWEQVPAVLPVWEACADVLRRIGYSVAVGVLNAEQYGVPQTRRRAILVARAPWFTRQHGPAALPTPTHSRYHNRTPGKMDPGVLPWVSMADALGSAYAGGAIRSNYGTGGDPAARGVRVATEPAATVTSKVDRNRWVPEHANPGETDDAVAWTDVRPSPTIVGSFAPDVVAAPGYRKAGDGPRQKATGSVRVTVEEAAVLQSFPATYPWQGTKTARYRQVGDAVPPLLAYHVVRAAAAIDHHLDDPAPGGGQYRPGDVMCSAGATAPMTAGQAPRDPNGAPSATITGKGTAAWVPADRYADPAPVA